MSGFSSGGLQIAVPFVSLEKLHSIYVFSAIARKSKVQKMEKKTTKGEGEAANKPRDCSFQRNSSLEQQKARKILQPEQRQPASGSQVK